jgi:hypothetical protein
MDEITLDTLMQCRDSLIGKRLTKDGRVLGTISKTRIRSQTLYGLVNLNHEGSERFGGADTIEVPVMRVNRP